MPDMKSKFPKLKPVKNYQPQIRLPWTSVPVQNAVRENQSTRRMQFNVKASGSARASV